MLIYPNTCLPPLPSISLLRRSSLRVFHLRLRQSSSIFPSISRPSFCFPSISRFRSLSINREGSGHENASAGIKQNIRTSEDERTNAPLIWDSDGNSLLKVDGSIEIPYISDENANEDPEIKFTVRDDGPISKRLKEAMISKGKEMILEKVRFYVQTMAKGGPAKDELEPKKVAPKSQASAKKEAAGSSPAIVEKEKKKSKEGFKTITLTEKFSCRARICLRFWWMRISGSGLHRVMRG